MKKIFERRSKLNINKGDEVIVICGKDKGKKGVVKAVFLKKNLIVVDGINKFKKAMRINQSNNENFLIKERPIFSSKVKVINSTKKSKPKSFKKDNKDIKDNSKKKVKN